MRARLTHLLVTAAVLSGAAAMLGPSSALAADCPSGGSTSWTNPAGGSWDVSANWSNGVPAGGCIVSVTLAGTYTVVMPNGGSADGLTLGGSSGTQTLAVAGSTSMANAPIDSLFSLGVGGMSIGDHGVLQYTSVGTSPGAATSTGGGTITNDGLIRTDVGTHAGTRDIQNQVVNNADGTVALHADTVTCGCGGTHQWTNAGTITTDAGTVNTFTGTAGGVVYTQTGGTFTNNGRAVIAGTVNHTGGTTTGNAIEVCGALNAPGPGAASFEFDQQPGIGCGGGEIDDDIGAGTSVRIFNDDAGHNLAVNSTRDYTNSGTITLDGTAGAQQDVLIGGHVLTNNGTITLSQPGSSQIQMKLANHGTVHVTAGTTTVSGVSSNDGNVTVDAGSTLYPTNDFTDSGGTIAVSGTLRNSSTFTHTGGDTTGNPITLCSATLDAPGPGTASFQFVAIPGDCGGGGIGSSSIGIGDRVDFHTTTGTVDYFDVTFVNHGTLTSSGAGTTQLHNGNVGNDGTVDLHGAHTNLAGFTTNSGGSFTVAAGSTSGLQSLDMSGGTLNVAGDMGDSGPANQTGGTITVDGTLSLDQGLALSAGRLQGTGAITAAAPVTNSGGTVHPGHSPGTLTITGAYAQQSGGTLAIDVDGTSAGSYSKLAVSGAATLAGTLAVSTSSPITGSIQVLTAGSLSGTFAPVTFAGQTDSVGYDATSVTLSGTAPPSNSAAPAISGTPAVGSTLSTTDGSWSGSPTSFAYQWRDCDAAGGACTDIPGATANAYVVTSSDVGHMLRVVVTATNSGGTGSATSDPTATVPQPGDGKPPPDTTKPVIRSAGASPSTFAIDTKGKAETAVAAIANPHRGTTLKYTLSENARVVFTIGRRATGRKSGGRCVPATRKNRRKRSCTRFVRAGRFAVNSASGANGHHFTGRIGSRKLTPGRYRATLVATDAAGNRSAPAGLLFKIVSR